MVAISNGGRNHRSLWQGQSTPPPADGPPAASQFDWSHYNLPFGELKAATYTPTQRIGNTGADALRGLGMQP